MDQATRQAVTELWQAIDFLWQSLQETWVVSDEKRRAVAHTIERIESITRQYEHEWHIAARSRDEWSAELDAVEAEVNLLKAAIADIEIVVRGLRQAEQLKRAKEQGS